MDVKKHHAVQHPVTLRRKRHRDRMSPVGRVNDFLLTHLAVVFGLAWTVWIFMFVTVAAYWMPAAIQAKIFFFSSGCIQLFALPLMVYVGNKLQRSSDAQSEVMHLALTHIATAADEVRQLLDLETPGGLTDVRDEVKAVREQLSGPKLQRPRAHRQVEVSPQAVEAIREGLKRKPGGA